MIIDKIKMSEEDTDDKYEQYDYYLTEEEKKLIGFNITNSIYFYYVKPSRFFTSIWDKIKNIIN